MGDEDFHEIVELGYLEDPGEEIAVMRIDSDPQRHFVLAIGNAIFDHILNHFFVLVVSLVLLFGPAAVDVSFDTLVDEDLCELIFG